MCGVGVVRVQSGRGAAGAVGESGGAQAAAAVIERWPNLQSITMALVLAASGRARYEYLGIRIAPGRRRCCFSMSRLTQSSTSASDVRRRTRLHARPALHCRRGKVEMGSAAGGAGERCRWRVDGRFAGVEGDVRRCVECACVVNNTSTGAPLQSGSRAGADQQQAAAMQTGRGDVTVTVTATGIVDDEGERTDAFALAERSGWGRDGSRRAGCVWRSPPWRSPPPARARPPCPHPQSRHDRRWPGTSTSHRRSSNQTAAGRLHLRHLESRLPAHSSPLVVSARKVATRRRVPCLFTPSRPGPIANNPRHWASSMVASSSARDIAGGSLRCPRPSHLS